jgi:uncharacterized protein YdbL (DUF1318 family)
MPPANWKQQYVKKIAAGGDADTILGELQINQWTLDDALRSDAAFAESIRSALSGGYVGETVEAVKVTAAELKKLGEAQVNETRTAGYFGMTVDEFKAVLKEKPELSRVYDLAALRGQAVIQLKQFEESADGDAEERKWWGKNHLGQSDKIETKVTVEEITDPRELAKRLAFLNARLGMIIDGQVTEPKVDEPVMITEGETE